MVMLQQMIVMFLMMAVGYLCYRKQILTEEVSRKVSAIVVNVANPCMILSSALTDQQMQGKELVQTLAIVVMMYAFLLVVAQLLPRILCIQKESRGAYAAMTVFANIGFMGFPVLAAMYGNGALLYGAVFQIPFNILIYTYGVAVLTRKQGACAKAEPNVKAEVDVKTEPDVKAEVDVKEEPNVKAEQDVKAEPNGKTGERQDAQGITAAVNGMSENIENGSEQQGKLQGTVEIVKKIFNIGVIACITAMLLYFLQTPVPSFLQAFITNLGNLTAPLSMMIIGASLAQMPLKELFLDKKLLLFSLVKLLLLPAVWMIMVNRVAEQEILRGVCLVMMATPAGSMTAMLAQQYGGDYETASRGVALTTVLSVITMPLLAAVFL
jgi:predicted permease